MSDDTTKTINRDITKTVPSITRPLPPLNAVEEEDVVRELPWVPLSVQEQEYVDNFVMPGPTDVEKAIALLPPDVVLIQEIPLHMSAKARAKLEAQVSTIGGSDKGKAKPTHFVTVEEGSEKLIRKPISESKVPEGELIPFPEKK